MRVERGRVRVEFLAPDNPRVLAFMDRLCRLVRRLEGAPRSTVIEALRRQERRVRDVSRLAGISKALLDACVFQPPPGAARAAEVRRAVFAARALRWPPVPGDDQLPFQDAAQQLELSVPDVKRWLYADLPSARVLVKAPTFSGRALLSRYNLELARAVLLDAERVRVTARGDWRGIFRAVKVARVMHTLTRVGKGYRLELTGPAAAFVSRPQRYGARLARVVPALARAPGWRLEAELRHGEETVRFAVRGSSGAKRGAKSHDAQSRGASTRDATTRAPVGQRAVRTGFDSKWERSLDAELRARIKAAGGEWTLSRETTPVPAGDELLLPDFTLRHADGREALVEVVGFWTPEYLEAKARKVAAAGLDHLVLVVYRGLAVGRAGAALVNAAGAERIVWFVQKPKAAEVLRAAERWGRAVD
jgi:predicted nuclease of restriction endonuclease-like RecB superfamily